MLTEKNKKEDLSFVHYAVENIEDIDDVLAERVYCRTHQQPIVIGENEEFFLREFLMSDAKIIKTIYEEDKEGFLECFFDNEEEAEVYLKSYINNYYDFYGYGLWAICMKATGEMMGMGGFSSRRNVFQKEEKEVMELGFAILNKYQERGIATQAVRVMLSYAEKNISGVSIYAKTKKNNVKAQKVLKKVGFIIEDGIWWH